MRKFVTTKIMDSRFISTAPPDTIRNIMERVINRFDCPLYRRTHIIDDFIDIITNDRMNCCYNEVVEYTIPFDASRYIDRDLAENGIYNVGDYYLQYRLSCRVNHNPFLPDRFYDIVVFKHTLVDTDYNTPKDKDIDIIRDTFDKISGAYRIKCNNVKDYIGKEDPREDVNETMPNVTMTPPSTTTTTTEEKPSKPKEKKAIKVMIKPNRNTIESIKSIIDDLDNKIEKLGRYMDDYIQDITEDLENSSKKLKEVLKGIGIK